MKYVDENSPTSSTFSFVLSFWFCMNFEGYSHEFFKVYCGNTQVIQGFDFIPSKNRSLHVVIYLYGQDGTIWFQLCFSRFIWYKMLVTTTQQVCVTGISDLFALDYRPWMFPLTPSIVSFLMNITGQLILSNWIRFIQKCHLLFSPAIQ